jgi:hypothetical protein
VGEGQFKSWILLSTKSNSVVVADGQLGARMNAIKWDCFRLAAAPDSGTRLS